MCPKGTRIAVDRWSAEGVAGPAIVVLIGILALSQQGFLVDSESQPRLQIR